MGMCISFNIDSSIQSYTGGSQFGLELLLNIEEYEQVAGLAQFSGVKVSGRLQSCLHC
jgi:hypothetical protein